MKIDLHRIDDAFHLQAVNEDGNTIETDGSPDIGGGGKGMRPMQVVLAALGSCSSIDVILLLRKQKQDLRDIRVSIEAEREADKTPSLFTNIHVHYQLFGAIDDKKAHRAVSLSMEKLCSVAKILEKTAVIKWSYEVAP